ncbi:MAG: CoA transferase [Bryobacterales bacterium]
MRSACSKACSARRATSPAASYWPTPTRHLVGVAQGNIAPYPALRVRDAPIIAGALNQRTWARFCKAIAHEELVEDPRFLDNPARSHNRAALTAILEEVFRAKRGSLARSLRAPRSPCGPVLSMRDALAQPVVGQRGAIVDVEPSAYGPVRLVGGQCASKATSRATSAGQARRAH